MIGIDPHKGSHTAVAVDATENELGRLRVRASGRQVEQLLAWAQDHPGRMWAVESANGWGYLLSQQLLAAGERVLDVPATLAARVRVLGSGRSNKNDANDARSVERDLRGSSMLENARSDLRSLVVGAAGAAIGASNGSLAAIAAGTAVAATERAATATWAAIQSRPIRNASRALLQHYAVFGEPTTSA